MTRAPPISASSGSIDRFRQSDGWRRPQPAARPAPPLRAARPPCPSPARRPGGHRPATSRRRSWRSSTSDRGSDPTSSRCSSCCTPAWRQGGVARRRSRRLRRWPMRSRTTDPRHGVTTPLERDGSGGVAWTKEEPLGEPTARHAGARPGASRAPLVRPAGFLAPDLSVVMVVHNMRREAPRSLRSLSPRYQQGLDGRHYEVIVVENGSDPDQRLGAALVEGFGSHVPLHRHGRRRHARRRCRP